MEVIKGETYINRLMPEYKVIVTNISQKEMWGQTGKEYVTIIKYDGLDDYFGGETTQSNFIMKFISLQDKRDELIGQILDNK